MTAPQDSRPLTGCRIVDLSSVLTGPFATHLLADHGATVIKVESPAGDITRRVGAAPQPGMASIFQHLNRGKRSVVLDLKHPKGLAALKRLLVDADALVYNIRPESMRRLGLSYDDVRAISESIVYCGLLGFGERGRYAGRPAYDDLIQGISAVPDLAARSDGSAPRYAPMAMADRIVGLYGAVGLLMALLQRMQTGKGMAVEIPMFESMAHFVLVEHMFYRSFDPALGDAGNPRALDINRRPYETRDGYICVLPYSDRNWQDLFGLIGCPEKREDARFTHFAGRLAHIGELYELLTLALRTKTTDEWLVLLGRADIPAMRMNTLEELLADPHLDDVGFFQPTGSGPSRFVHMASPIEWPQGSIPPIDSAPLLGEQSIDVLRGAGLTEVEIDELVEQGVTAGPDLRRDGVLPAAASEMCER